MDICKCGQCVEAGKKHFCIQNNTIHTVIDCAYCGINIINTTHYWVEGYKIPAVKLFEYKPICERCQSEINRFLYQKL